ncbi:hemolysin-III related-domain-containing protein [Aspergillus flavus]|uniref:Hemolysin-III related-domain-containing protein n=2 Tax=Aspergillus subgen. Circumdati TaxID=2720871 RepID=A0A5N6HCC1_ASPFL|nr:putative membrane protein [Aspergillus oryzae 3.042]KAB8252126.1 hemolysin-III related-domain-containing protein [Aspergillus flavus]KDE79685.1 putative membrane protein [Aspergillus oryzae 100-8]|eukprot:EIT82074.1 putative membrane protein [Aspergillus oryzae 3.042]
MASLRLALTCFLTPSPPKATENFHAANTEPPQKKQVFHASEIPEWMQWDPYIQHGYRTQLNSFKQCFLSLFYMHNESVNTWSHIVLEISFLILLLAIDYWIAQLPFKVPFSDMLAIQSYVAGTAGCLVFSAAFHTTNAHSPEVARAFLKLDYFGIVLTISTTCISVAYFTSTLQLAYILFTVLCAAMVFCITLDVGMDGARAGPWRATVFLLLAASDLAPIFHVGWNEASRSPVRRMPSAPWHMSPGFRRDIGRVDSISSYVLTYAAIQTVTKMCRVRVIRSSMCWLRSARSCICLGFERCWSAFIWFGAQCR